MSLGTKIIFSVGAVIIGILGVTFYMLFFGTPVQVDDAGEILKGLFAFVGGGGIFMLAQRVLQWMMKKR